jgi:1-acyl-sn-glycerol-3-phosphate acyltransferase
MIAQTIIRAIVREWIRAAVWFRFRDVKFVFHAPLPMDESAILVGSHQNAILDSMALAACSPKVPHTLSRGALFQGPFTRWFLESLRMVPVYRFRDGFGRMRKNAGMFEAFVEVLRKNEWLLTFPEGSHYLRYTLRPFQKGIARIAFAAQEAQDWEKEIPIYPVGLQYESHTTFGSRLLIQYGLPVSSLAFKEAHAENPKRAERELTAGLFQEVKRLLILPPSDDEAYERALRRWNQNKGRFPDLMDQFKDDERLMAREQRIADPESTGHEEPLSGEVGGGFEAESRKNPIMKLAGYVLSLPGVVLHLPVILVTLALEKWLVVDRHLVPAARWLGGMFLVPLWYLVALALCHLLTGSLPGDLILLLSMPLSLWMWSRCWHLRG